MPAEEELADIPYPSEDDGSATEENDDGSTTVSWPDGVVRVDYPGGSVMITFADGAVLNQYPDGTATLNDVNGVALDTTTGAPLEESPELPTPPDQGPDYILRVMEGDERLADLEQAADLAKTLADTIMGELNPAEWFKTWIEMVIHVFKAIETEERGAYMRGWCYTVLYSALDMGTPPEPEFTGSVRGPDHDALDKQGWEDGVSAGDEQMNDGATGSKLRNRILLRVAHDGGEPNKSLDALWHAACERTDDRDLARAYQHLRWPEPTGA